MAIIFASLIIGAAILGGAYVMKPLTPTEKCWDVSVTFERHQKAGDKAFGSVDPQKVYANCLVETRGN